MKCQGPEGQTLAAVREPASACEDALLGVWLSHGALAPPLSSQSGERCSSTPLPDIGGLVACT